MSVIALFPKPWEILSYCEIEVFHLKAWDSEAWSAKVGRYIQNCMKYWFKQQYLLRCYTWGWYTVDCKLQQYIAATNHSFSTGRGTRSSNMSWRHIAVTNHFMCTGEFLPKSLSPQHNFVDATRCTNSATCCDDKILLWRQNFQRNSSVHTKWFVAATCHCNMLLQHDMSPSVFWPFVKANLPYEIITDITKGNMVVQNAWLSG